MTDLAVADLADRLKIRADRVVIVSIENVTWPDASLGDPRPGTMYAQVLCDGVRIVLQHGDRHYEYHASDQGEPFLCANPRPGVPRQS